MSAEGEKKTNPWPVLQLPVRSLRMTSTAATTVSTILCIPFHLQLKQSVSRPSFKEPGRVHVF